MTKILAFIKNLEGNEGEEGYYILKVLFDDILKRFPLISTHYEAEELFHDFLLNKIMRKSELLQAKENMTAGYIRVIIDRYFIDIFRSIRFQTALKTVSLDKPLFHHEGASPQMTLKDFLVDEQHSRDQILFLRAIDVAEILTRSLSVMDKKVLCYIFTKNELFLAGISTAARYQRVCRFKQKLKRFIEKNGLESDAFDFFCEHMLDVIICTSLNEVK